MNTPFDAVNARGTCCATEEHSNEEKDTIHPQPSIGVQLSFHKLGFSRVRIRISALNNNHV